MITACEKYLDYVGDEWENSLMIVEGMSVAEILVLSVDMLDQLDQVGIVDWRWRIRFFVGVGLELVGY